MEIPVSAQALTFAQGALLGLGLCLAYDLLRALRQIPDREYGVQAPPETALAGEPGGGAFAGESH